MTRDYAVCLSNEAKAASGRICRFIWASAFPFMHRPTVFFGASRTQNSGYPWSCLSLICMARSTWNFALYLTGFSMHQVRGLLQVHWTGLSARCMAANFRRMVDAVYPAERPTDTVHLCKNFAALCWMWGGPIIRDKRDLCHISVGSLPTLVVTVCTVQSL